MNTCGHECRILRTGQECSVCEQKNSRLQPRAKNQIFNLNEDEIMQKTGFPANSKMLLFVREEKQGVRIAINADRIDAVIDAGEATKLIVGGKEYNVLRPFREVMFIIEAAALTSILDKTRLLVKWELQDRDDLIFGKKEADNEQD